jgi:hypothetical protein
MRAKFMAVNLKDDNGKWQEWSETVECNILVVYNIDKELITVYTEEEQDYDIVSVEVSELESEINIAFACVDNFGDKCQVILTKYSVPEDTGKITFMSNNMAWVYLLVWL